MITAILLDIDGTMRDSRAMIYYAYQRTFEHFGLPQPDKNDIAQHMHAGPEPLFSQFVPNTDTKPLVSYYRETLGGVLDKISAYEGVAETLQALRKQHIKLAAVSSSKYAKSDLIANNISQYMDFVVDGHMVEHSKPHPEGASLALRELGVRPEEAIMVGDLPADIMLGKAAKLQATVAVTHGFATKELLTKSNPDYYIDSFDELLDVVRKLHTN
jgi:pyrophosphatase PpaX